MLNFFVLNVAQFQKIDLKHAIFFFFIFSYLGMVVHQTLITCTRWTEVKRSFSDLKIFTSHIFKEQSSSMNHFVRRYKYVCQSHFFGGEIQRWHVLNSSDFLQRQNSDQSVTFFQVTYSLQIFRGVHLGYSLIPNIQSTSLKQVNCSYGRVVLVS